MSRRGNPNWIKAYVSAPYRLGLVTSSQEGSVRRKLGLRQKASVVVCPTAKLPAEIKLHENLRMESCSRWPEFEVD